MPAGKSDERFVSLTESKFTNVVVGGQINLSLADARGLYKLTTEVAPIPKDATPEQRDAILNEGRDACVQFVRELAMKILFTSGETTGLSELMDMFKEPVIDPFDQPLPSDRVQK